MTTAEKLVRLRKEKGLSQLQLAEEIMYLVRLYQGGKSG